MKSILFQDNGRFKSTWFEALAHYLPDYHVRVWEPNDTAPADYAIVWKPEADFFNHRSTLKAVFSRGAGVDGIMQNAQHIPAHIPIVRLQDAGMGVQMAEYVVHAVLDHFRKFPAYRHFQHSQAWNPLPAPKREQCRVGVLGMGILGKRVIDALKHFEFPVAAWSRSAKSGNADFAGVECYAGEEQLGTFLSRSQILVCLLPLTPETRDILNAKRLAQLPAGAYLINVARGEHVVEEDLVAAIQSGHLSGARLDVMRAEPLPPTHPFWQDTRIQVTPHISAITVVDESVAQIAANIARIERGEQALGVIDRARGY